jgi:hypothetical protein
LAEELVHRWVMQGGVVIAAAPELRHAPADSRLVPLDAGQRR